LVIATASMTGSAVAEPAKALAVSAAMSAAGKTM
jgi:hypothetical protein